jgi:hypothetical protein
VTKLKIVNSNLKYIQIDAFNSQVFNKTSTLEVNNASSNSTHMFHIFSKTMFNGLTSLQKLTITNTASLEIIGQDIFEPMSETLTDVFINGITNTFSLSRVFGSTKYKLKKISSVNLKNNNFESLNASCFNVVAENVVNLYLINSKIKSLAPNTFQYFERLRILSLHDNELTTLPEGVFDNLLLNPGLEIALDKNKWNCVCEFLSVQEIVQANQNVFKESVTCYEPEEYKGIALQEANLCADVTKQTTEIQCNLDKSENGCTPVEGKVSKVCFSDALIPAILIKDNLKNLNFFVV